MEGLYFAPPSSSKCSIIRSRASKVTSLPDVYSSVRSVRNLGKEGFCDPHDPCCLKRDPEVFLHQDILRAQARKECVPKNPLHFEYTILHRIKLKGRLRMAAERQQNPELTDEEIERIRLEEEEISTSHPMSRMKPTMNSSQEYFAEHPDIAPPSPELINGEELQRTLDGLTSVALAHEIALNKDFQLVMPDKKTEVDYIPSSISREEEVRQAELKGDLIMKEAQLTLDAKDRYWLMVDHVLLTKAVKDAKNTVLDLINTLKTMLKATMLPHNLRMKLKIDQQFDLEKITKEIDRDVFEFRPYMEFVLDTLSSLCCPIHDEEILEIRNIELPSRQIKKCIELMEAMNLDMANFIISQSRKQVLQNCVLYERNNFAIFLEGVYRLGKDPLRIIRNWIRRHTIPERDFSETMAHCFAELLDCEENMELPETLMLDLHRFPAIRNEIKRITIIGAIVSAVYDYSHSLLLESPEDAKDFEKSQIATLKNLRLLSKLRGEMDKVVVIQDLDDKTKLAEALERSCEHALQVVDQHLVSETCEGLTPQQKEDVAAMIMQLSDLSNSSRLELQNKVKEWFIEVAKEDGREKIQAPSNLSIIGPLIIVPITEMMRLCMYNRGVFDVLYQEVLYGNCPPPTVFPPRREEHASRAAVVLDANKEADKESPFPLDEGIMRLVNKLKEFSSRTMVYKRSHIDPRIKPMYEADGTPIIPPEQRPEYRPKEMTAIEQKHFDEYLLAHEPTLEEDYDGVYVFNVGDPDWMFGYTTEQLLKMMERENLINANKLRRVKERLEHEVLEQRVADNLPIFQKIMREEVGTLQKEYCRLQRILVKGPTPLPGDASDEPSAKRDFPGACVLNPPTVEEIPKFTKKGEPILYSRDKGSQFGQPSPSSELVEDPEGMDLDRFEVYDAVEGEEEDLHATRGGRGRTPFDDSTKGYYFETKQKPETPVQVLKRNISIGIEREKTKRLTVGGLRIQIQKSFENSLNQPKNKDFRKPKFNPFAKKTKPRARTNYYPGSQEDDSQFDLPNTSQSRRDLFQGNSSVPLMMLPIYQQAKSMQAQIRRRQRRPYQGTMSRAAIMEKRRSAQFHIMKVPVRRSSSTPGPVQSKDSLDSLEPFLGSLQEEATRKSMRKSRRVSQIPPVEEAPPPKEDKEGEVKQVVSDEDMGKSGKIRFEIPIANDDKPKDPAVQAKIKERRPTSMRTTRFTVPNARDNKDNLKDRRQSGTSFKTVKTPRFGNLPAKAIKDRKVSLKIRERRPTPMFTMSPMFAYLPQVTQHHGREEKELQPLHGQKTKPGLGVPFTPRAVLPTVGIFPSVFRQRASQKIQQRSKIPEPNEVAQELKKSNIPIKGHHRPGTTPTGESGVDKVDVEVLKPIDDDYEDPGAGLMRIRKRRNIGRILSPPYSRNERSNSMTVLDFRNSMFYKRTKSTMQKGSFNGKDAKRQLISSLNKNAVNKVGDDWKGADKVRFD